MTPDDAADVARLADQLGYPSSASQVRDRILDVSPRPGGRLLVAETSGGAIVGWVHVHGEHLLESEPYAEISGLVVDAAFRRGGVGRKLMTAAEEWARSSGYGTVRLRTNTARVGAKPFYEALGYELLKTQYALLKRLDAE
jgi:GNAT superfamily N-acetyltransferase